MSRLTAAFLLMFLALTPSSRAEPARTAASDNGVVIETDPRVELISVVGLLSDYFLITEHDIAYRREAETYFEPFRNHPAVLTFKRLSKDGRSREDFAFSRVPDALVRFSAPPALKFRNVTSDIIPDDENSRAQLAELMPQLRDFAKVSRFNEFYRAHSAFYANLATASRPKIAPSLQDLERYTGTRIEGAHVVLAPLLHDGGFATMLKRSDGGTEGYAFIGPETAVDDAPDFGDQARMDDLVTHEFAHLIINPLTSRHAAEVALSANHWAPIADAMQRRGNPEWASVVNELIIRAITTRLVTQKRGEAAGAAALKRELDWGYAYLPALIESLKTYETNRERYSSIADFYPKLLAALASAPRPSNPSPH